MQSRSRKFDSHFSPFWAFLNDSAASTPTTRHWLCAAQSKAKLALFASLKTAAWILRSVRKSRERTRIESFRILEFDSQRSAVLWMQQPQRASRSGRPSVTLAARGSFLFLTLLALRPSFGPLLLSLCLCLSLRSLRQPLRVELSAVSTLSTLLHYPPNLCSCTDSLFSLPLDYTHTHTHTLARLSLISPVTYIVADLRHSFPSATWRLFANLYSLILRHLPSKALPSSRRTTGTSLHRRPTIRSPLQHSILLSCHHPVAHITSARQPYLRLYSPYTPEHHNRSRQHQRARSSIAIANHPCFWTPFFLNDVTFGSTILGKPTVPHPEGLGVCNFAIR